MNNIDTRQFLPKSKFDLENARKIVYLEYHAIASLLPELFVWIQDANWPVAKVLAPFLASIGDPVIPLVRNILSSNDNIWKYSVLSQVVKFAPKSVGSALKNEITRIATFPTDGEKREGVQAIAKEILSTL